MAELFQRSQVITQVNPNRTPSDHVEESDSEEDEDESHVEENENNDSSDSNAEAEAEEVDEAALPAFDPVWEFQQTFVNRDHFNTFLLQELTWSVRRTVTLQRGVKTVYRCNKVKRRGLQCTAAIYTVHDSAPKDDSIQMYRLSVEHNCQHAANRVTKVSDVVKSEIIRLHTIGNSNKTVEFVLRKNTDIIQPTKNQIRYIIEKYKKKKYGNPTITLNDLFDFAKEHFVPPEDDDIGYVVGFDRSRPNQDEKWFRIFFSTKRLLRTALETNVLHADGTYKIIIQGFPVLVIGVTDYAKRFHLCGLAICSSESGDDFRFLFQSLSNGVQNITHNEINPRYLVADASAAITKGFNDTFENDETIRINCFSHLMMNVDKYKFQDTEQKSNIKNDIKKLQQSSSQSQFDVGCDLFIKKWTQTEPEFTMHFNNVYIKANNMWYAGAGIRVPKTNNALENFNRQMKSHQTFYKRQNLNVFLHRALEIVEERSVEYRIDRKEFQKTCEVSDDLLINGYQYSDSEKSMVTENLPDGSCNVYVFSGDNMNKITLEEVRKFEDATYENFDEFSSKAFIIYKITLTATGRNWKNAICTCTSFAKNYMCKHIVAIAYRLGILNKPDSLLSTVPIAAKNKRGRPKKATKALIVD